MNSQTSFATSSGHVLAALTTTPDATTMRTAAARLGLSDTVLATAFANLSQGRAVGAILSGKMASGKDTVADCVAVRLPQYGLAPGVVHRSSDPIRAELSQVIGLISPIDSISQATATLVSAMALPKHAAAEIVRTFFALVRPWPAVDVRTNTNRYLLQYLADVGRRSVDPEYWVKRCFAQLLTTISEGHSAFLAGGRYPNEIQPAQVLGLSTIRFHVTDAVQAARLKGRGDAVLDCALLTGENECALDNYVGFNLMVTNNGLLEPTVKVVLDHLVRHSENMRVCMSD